MRKQMYFPLVLTAFFSACSLLSPQKTSEAHLQQRAAFTPNSKSAPPEIETAISLPKPRADAKIETYSVIVNRVSIPEILLTLAKDAKLNLDIHPDVAGEITMNALDETLIQIMNRIKKQADLRYTLKNNHLFVEPDTPFLTHYQIDYVNMAREVSGTVATNTQISTSGLSSNSNESSGSANSNVSRIEIRNFSKNQFWVSLENNLRDILRETDKILPEGSSETVSSHENNQSTTGTGANTNSANNANMRQTSKATKTSKNSKSNNASLANSPNAASLQESGNTIVRHSTFREASSVIAHPETGVLSVRATERQHEKVREFIDKVMNNARRQVLIEATIIEVQLSEGYEQGIDWSRMRADGSGFSVATPSLSTRSIGAVTPFILKYADQSQPLNILTTFKWLESFGQTKVLSSPKLSVLNNQTATLKVSEEFVYFLVKTDIAAGNNNTSPITAVTTTPQSVSVGLFMSVTPQISQNGAITLNVRPSISSIADLKPDPNPSIPAGMQNLVPQIRTREIESVMRVESGDIAVLGGLMEDRMENANGRIPIVGAIPFFGELFNSRANSSRRSELVIFLRPTIIHEASINGDFKAQQIHLPSDNFLQKERVFEPFLGSLKP